MEFVVNTENDGESKSKEFHFQYLRKFKDELLSRMITVLVWKIKPNAIFIRFEFFFDFLFHMIILLLNFLKIGNTAIKRYYSLNCLLFCKTMLCWEMKNEKRNCVNYDQFSYPGNISVQSQQ